MKTKRPPEAIVDIKIHIRRDLTRAGVAAGIGIDLATCIPQTHLLKVGITRSVKATTQRQEPRETQWLGPYDTTKDFGIILGTENAVSNGCSRYHF